MDLDDEICRCYEAQLAAIAALDRAYYLKQNPTLAERAEYAQRMQELESIRDQFYSEWDALRRAPTEVRPN
jgi:hypothetical protein